MNAVLTQIVAACLLISHEAAFVIVSEGSFYRPIHKLPRRRLWHRMPSKLVSVTTQRPTANRIWKHADQRSRAIFPPSFLFNHTLHPTLPGHISQLRYSIVPLPFSLFSYLLAYLYKWDVINSTFIHYIYMYSSSLLLRLNSNCGIHPAVPMPPIYGAQSESIWWRRWQWFRWFIYRIESLVKLLLFIRHIMK